MKTDPAVRLEKSLLGHAGRAIREWKLVETALVMYDGAIRRELAGAEITEHALVSSALNIGAEAARADAPAAPRA